MIKKTPCVFVLIIIGLSFVFAVDLETRIGYIGDAELAAAGIGDAENAISGNAEDFISPEVSVNSPSEGVTYTSNPIFFNVSMNEAGSCNYSTDSGVTNYSMSSVGLSGIATQTLANGNYTARFYCSDANGNLNLSESVSFVVSVSSIVVTPSSGGGGGGGGGAVVINSTLGFDEELELDLDYENFKIRSVVGDTKYRQFSLKNVGNESISVSFRIEGEDVEGGDGELSAFSDFFELEFDSVVVGAGEDLDVNFDVVAPMTLGIFTGKIILQVGNSIEEIPVSIATQSKETIFDVTSTVIDETIQDNEDVKVQIDLLPVGERGIDITLRYSIKDFSGETYYENSETFYVNSPMSFVKEFPTEGLLRGDYVVATEMIYLGGFASASSQFEIIDESIFGGFRLTLGVMFLVGVVLIVVLIVVILSFRLRKVKKIEEKDKEIKKKVRKKGIKNK